MLFKEFFQVKEVSTCRDLKGSDSFSYPYISHENIGSKLNSFSHKINDEDVQIGMYEYNDFGRHEHSSYIWIDEKTKKKIAQLNYIHIKIKIDALLKKVICGKYFFIIKEYRGNGLLTPIYESIISNNTISKNILVSDIKQTPSMNNFWKKYLIPNHNASVLISSKIGSHTIWVDTETTEGKRELSRLYALKKLDRSQKIEPLNDYVNGNEVFNDEKFRILIQK